MIGKKNIKPDPNFTKVSLMVFIDYYNQHIPEGFPKASEAILNKFKETHSSLFSGDNNWTIDKHRKKLMDWIPSCRLMKN